MNDARTGDHKPAIDELPLDLFGGEGEQPPQSVAECQWCDASLPENADVCPACGATVPDPNARFPGLTDPYPVEARELERMQAERDSSTFVSGFAAASLGAAALDILDDLIGD